MSSLPLGAHQGGETPQVAPAHVRCGSPSRRGSRPHATGDVLHTGAKTGAKSLRAGDSAAPTGPAVLGRLGEHAKHGGHHSRPATCGDPTSFSVGAHGQQTESGGERRTRPSMWNHIPLGAARRENKPGTSDHEFPKPFETLLNLVQSHETLDYKQPASRCKTLYKPSPHNLRSYLNSEGTCITRYQTQSSVAEPYSSSIKTPVLII